MCLSLTPRTGIFYEILKIKELASYITLSLNYDENDKSVLAVEPMDPTQFRELRLTFIDHLNELLKDIEDEYKRLDADLYFV